MPPKRQNIDPIIETRDLLRKLLVLELFHMGVAQIDIAKKVHIDTHIVNEFLKGIKKSDSERNE